MRWMVLVLLGAAACGARSTLREPPRGSGGASATTSSGAGGRQCLPDCTIGHACCVGGCDGPAASTPNDCCECLADEMSSEMCPGAMCGAPPSCKPEGQTCETAADCCSGVCVYATPFDEKPSCLPATFACGSVLSCKTAREYCQVLDGFALGFGCKPLPASCLPPSVASCTCMPIAPDCGMCGGPDWQITEAHGCG